MDNTRSDSIDSFIKHYNLIFATSEDGVLLLDLHSTEVLAANLAAQTMLASLTGQLIGVNLKDFDLFSQLPTKSDAVGNSLLESIFALRGLELQSDSDAPIFLDLVGNQCLIDGTAFCHLTLEDVTQQRQIEEKLDVYVKRLEWSNRELQEFAHIASHDLQEPLRAIQAFSDRLSSNYRQQLGEEGQEFIDRVHESASRMRILLNDLLAYSRVTSKARNLTLVSLNTVLESVCDDLETAIKESNASIEVGVLPTVYANPALLRQMFQNLISNSIKYRKIETTPIIRVFAISADSGVGMAQIEHNPSTDTVDVIVNDNGIGFDQKYAERIFGPFQRLHSQRRYQGTGIGLAICRKITEQCFGTISATSEIGVGTSIHITLPIRARVGGPE
jgi:two-component system sensor kinase FixL